jgi:hypothetical protein
MLDVDVLPAVFAEALQQRAGFFAGFQRAFQFHLPIGKIVVLNIDYKQGCVHKSP